MDSRLHGPLAITEGMISSNPTYSCVYPIHQRLGLCDGKRHLNMNIELLSSIKISNDLCCLENSNVRVGSCRRRTRLSVEVTLELLE